MSHMYYKRSSIELSSDSERTGVPKPLKTEEVFSEFGDGACGEPEFTQHLCLDFTPDPEIDNEISQKKICDFWKLINNTPEIKNLMVKAERFTKPPTPTEVVKDQPEENVIRMDKTACSVLEVIEEKEMISRAFEGRMPQSHCSLVCREYKEKEKFRQKERGHRVPIICRCTKICKPCPVKKPPGLPPLSEAKQLCAELQEWDDKHPKSMEPPGHPPALQHCTIQRQVFGS